MKKALSFYLAYLNTFMLAAIGAGILLGYYSPHFASRVAVAGDIFLRCLQFLIVPIIFFSMLAGILNLEKGNNLGRVGLKTFGYYFFTTAVAVATGLLLVNIIQPGMSGVLSPPAGDTDSSINAAGSLYEVVKNLIPTNIVEAAANGNVLGLIFFCIFLGIAIRHIEDKNVDSIAHPVSVMSDALIWMVDRVMILAPIGLLGLIAPLVADTVASQAFAELGYEIQLYTVTVLAGLLFHGLITLPAILFFCGVNPLHYAIAVLPAVTTAFSTASSAATLPLTIDSLQSRAGVPERFAGFVAPLGATVNMDGTAIYEAVAAVFIASMYGIDLTFPQQFTIFIVATLSSIGAAGIPGAGLIMMTLVLGSVGVPVEGIKLVVVVDRILDMIRTALNVWGDCIGAAIISKSEGAYAGVPASDEI